MVMIMISSVQFHYLLLTSSKILIVFLPLDVINVDNFQFEPILKGAL